MHERVATDGWLLPALLMLTLFASGCAQMPARNPLPETSLDVARIPGIADMREVRFWGDELPERLVKRLDALTDAQVRTRFPALIGRPAYYLAISGGGANGAYGAGLLTGWTEAGNRPEFSIVTGISTGALSAPFAFLGPAYDTQLREVYTTTSTGVIMTRRSALAALTGDAVFSSKPLQRLIARYIDEDLLRDIAVQYRLGRRLYIGTTNLDAMRPVVWDIGAIAAGGYPGAVDLVRRILLASASIPAAFPPVYFELEAGGQRYDEMHVDGGAASSVFVYPAGINWKKILDRLGVKEATVYVIRNSRYEAPWAAVKPRLGAIAGRAINSLLRTQGISDVRMIYFQALHDGLDFNLSYIPPEFTEEAREPFDREYMNRLFEIGYRRARDGYPWEKTPPALRPWIIEETPSGLQGVVQ